MRARSGDPGPGAGAPPDGEPSPEERCWPAGVLPDEETLDRWLLAWLDRAPGGRGDLFLEQRVHETGGLLVDADGPRALAPALRCDAGLGARLVTLNATELGHSSGLDHDAWARVLRGAADAGPRPLPAEPDGGGPPGARGRWPVASVLDLLGEQGDVACARLDLERDVRRTHVVSSEWGHAGAVTAWASAALEVTVSAGDRRSTARRGAGWAPEGAAGVSTRLREMARSALAAARERLAIVAAPGGSPAVLFAAGAGGVLVHEALGHALEADVVASGPGPLAAAAGRAVSSVPLTVVDDPTQPGRAGRHEVDDEGIAGRPCTLLDRGVVAGLLADAERAGFEAARLTGHARRASFRDPPLPRMTNTLVLGGESDPDQLLRGLGEGLLVTRVERGGADPTTGDFHLSVSESFLVEAGRAGRPLEPFVLLGNVASLLAGLDGVGSEVAWDDGRGRCGREGQWLRVAVGQPALRFRPGVLRVA